MSWCSDKETLIILSKIYNVLLSFFLNVIVYLICNMILLLFPLQFEGTYSLTIVSGYGPSTHGYGTFYANEYFQRGLNSFPNCCTVAFAVIFRL